MVFGNKRGLEWTHILAVVIGLLVLSVLIWLIRDKFKEILAKFIG